MVSSSITLANLPNIVYYTDDPTITHTQFSLVYAEKPENTDDPAAKYYVTRTDGYTKYYVKEFTFYNTI